MCMPSSLPRRNSWVHVSLASPEMAAFPISTDGRLPHLLFSRPCNVHSHYGLHIRQVTSVTHYTRGFSHLAPCATAPIATGWSDSSPGGVRTHWKTVPWHGARRLPV